MPPGDSTHLSRPQPIFPRSFGPKYQLLKHLATGGMADVFLARQIGAAGFVKECVIKRILPSLARDRQFVTMFLDEARLCARLNHPNIAQVFDHGQVGDDYFIAMELVDGVDLEQMLQKAHERGEERLPFPIAARIIAGIAQGLEHAHHAVDERGRPLGLVHRDVTPSNVMVSFDGVPKLLDFGIAKADIQSTKTETGVIKGKVPYMSPEQAQGEPLDARSDLFSLGSIAFELTTGEKPFQGDNAGAVSLRILHDEPTPPTLLVADYPEKLEAIVLGALAKRVEDRTPRARALHQQLERWLVDSRSPVTSYDVAAYLAERFPQERFAVTLVGGNSVADQQLAEAQPMEHDRHRPRETGQLSIGDPSLLGDLPGAGAGDARRNLGGGGRWMAGVIVGLVLATAGLMFLLRGYEMKKESKENAAAAAEAAPGGNEAAAAPPAGAPVDNRAAAEARAPAAPPQVVAAPAPPAVVAAKSVAPAPGADGPRVTPLPAQKAASATRRPVPHVHHAAPAHHEPTTLPSLPRLPGLPPTSAD